MVENELFSLAFSFAELASSVVIWINHVGFIKLKGCCQFIVNFILNEKLQTIFYRKIKDPISRHSL